MDKSAACSAQSVGCRSGPRTGGVAVRSCWFATTPPISFPQQFGTLGLDATRADAPHRLGSGRCAGGAAHGGGARRRALIESRVSRLVIDCNRPLDAPDLIPAVSETTAIPGNASLSPDETGGAHRAGL